MKNVMKYAFYGVFALISAALLSQVAAAGKNLDRMSVEELLPLAQKEGEVTVYSFTSRIFKVEDLFEQTYPGVDMIPVDMGSADQILRLKAEAAAGIANADVVYLASTPEVLTELLETGIVSTYIPPRLKDRIPDRYKKPLLGARLSTKVLMYNVEAYPDGSPVGNLWQLTTDEWSGRVVIVDPLQSGEYLDLMTEFVLRSDEMAKAYRAQFGKPIELNEGVKNAGEQFIIDLFDNRVVMVRSSDNVSAAVGGKGQDNPPVGFSTYSDIRDNERENWAMDLVNNAVPANGILYPAVLEITTNTTHPAAARLAIDFLMGDDSKHGGPSWAPWYVPGDYATRTDIENPTDAVPLNELNAWRLDPAATARIRQRVADLILMVE